MSTLILTGERTLPGIPHENYWFRRHEAAYAFLRPFVTGARVVEAGCGEGYGAALLAEVADRVVAVDADPDAAAHAGRTYPQVDVVRADLLRMPFVDGSMEVVASLQVIEHLHDQAAFAAECARVLRPGGTVLLTTPNRITFSPGRDTPLNPFHTRELSGPELAELVEPHFVVTRLLGVRHGRRLRRWERRHGGLVAQQIATPEPDWDERLRAAVVGVRADDFEVTADDVPASLDLVLVGYRRAG